MTEDIDRAILQLSAAKRLSAVSCMVALKRCNQETLSPLLELQNSLDIGLHLCFADETLRGLEGNITQLPSFGTLLRASLLSDLAKRARDQIEFQYELFLKKTGRAPDFIDGHLHSHQLRGIQSEVINFVCGLPAANRPYVRNTRHPLRQLRKRKLPWMKAALIGACGKKMQRGLAQAGVETNSGFTGIYDFREWRRYADYFPRFAECLGNPNGMLVVHPGEVEDWRRSEFMTLREFGFAPGQPNRFKRELRSTRSQPTPAI